MAHLEVGGGYKIHQLHLSLTEEQDYFNECPGYNTKQSDGEAPVILELWGIWSTLSLPLLPGPLWPEVVPSDRVLPRDQIELFDIQTMCKWIAYAKLNCLII